MFWGIHYTQKEVSKSEYLDPQRVFAFVFFFFFFFMCFLLFETNNIVHTLFTGPTTTLFRKKILKMNPTVLFTHLKIILL